MKFLKEVYDLIVERDNMDSIKREARTLGKRAHAAGDALPAAASEEVDRLLDTVDKHIEDGDAERADAYMEQVRNLLTKHHITEDCDDCEIVYVDENDSILTEGAKRAYQRKGGKVLRKFRCTSGPKKGKVVSDPKTCATRKDPKKKRIGKKVAREKKGIRIRKSKVAKRTSASKLVTKMNKRLSGK